jgi:RES domain-containing protein
MVTAWRIVKRKRAKGAFNVEGARRYGGRWNSVGVAVIYTAESQSLAALEVVVHLDSSELLDHYVLFEVGIDESLIVRVGPPELPRNWRADPPPKKTQSIGDAWAATGASAVLRVPSAVLPAEHDFLLNPRHQDFPRLAIGKPTPFYSDPRLAR